jgi:hypothetical protein
MSSGPFAVDFADDAFAHQRYLRARQEDEWPGEDYEGSSVHGVMQGAAKDRMIPSYWWCFGALDVALAVSWDGPVVIGVPWYEECMETDPNGFIHARGEIVGGHAIAVIGIDNDHVELLNSWGEEWGHGGVAKLFLHDLDEMLIQWGEAAVVRRYKPRPGVR